MADTARQDSGAVITAAVTCQVCGTVPCATPAEADARAEKHTRVTGHATTTEARRDGWDVPVKRGDP